MTLRVTTHCKLEPEHAIMPCKQRLSRLHQRVCLAQDFDPTQDNNELHKRLLSLSKEVELQGDVFHKVLDKVIACVKHLFKEAASNDLGGHLEQGGSLLTLLPSGTGNQKEEGEILRAWHSLLEAQLNIQDARTATDGRIMEFEKKHGKDYLVLCSREQALRKLDPEGKVVSTWSTLAALKQDISKLMALAAHVSLKEASDALEAVYKPQEEWCAGMSLTTPWADVVKAAGGLFVDEFASAIKTKFSQAHKADLT